MICIVRPSRHLRIESNTTQDRKLGLVSSFACMNAGAISATRGSHSRGTHITAVVA